MRRRTTHPSPANDLPDLSVFGDESVFLLHSNNPERYSLLAIGSVDEVWSPNCGNALVQLQEFLDKQDDWYFGYLSYELKNEIEPHLQSDNHDFLEFPVLRFIRPQTLVRWNHIKMIVESFNDDDINKVHSAFSSSQKENNRKPGITLKPQISRAHYLRDIMSLKGHIQQGDIYEVNYCTLFGAEANIDPYPTWRALNERTKAPFSAYMHCGDHYLLCASPERFLKRTGNRIISQPIKGTKKRSSDMLEDQKLREDLKNDPKERSENVMITDLVRNDLSKSALAGSVSVEELCAIYSFETVHQMISTVSAEVQPNVCFTQLIKDTFPMGSMTGAPKIRAMELIEKHEQMSRGLYSGCIGYIDPNGDFDFNVVIRSLLYNRQKPYLAAMVGGAITDGSRPEDEYQECLLKAQALLQTLE